MTVLGKNFDIFIEHRWKLPFVPISDHLFNL